MALNLRSFTILEPLAYIIQTASMGKCSVTDCQMTANDAPCSSVAFAAYMGVYIMTGSLLHISSS